jgi:hypothetical protein
MRAHTAHIRIHRSPKRQYRVCYQREDGAREQVRLFFYRDRAERFADRLVYGEDEWGELEYVRIEVRSVKCGPWKRA